MTSLRAITTIAASAITQPSPAGTLALDWGRRTEPQSSPASKALAAPPLVADQVHKMSDQRVPIPGSEAKPRAGERWSPDVSPDETVTATITLRRVGGPSEQDLLSGKYQAPSR